MDRWGTDDLAYNEPLMAAIGRIALRSSELAEIIDAVVDRLDKVKGEKAKTLMLGAKLSLAKETVELTLANYAQLRDQFIEFCAHVHSLLHHRNSPLHSTFLADDEDGKFIKWDTKTGPELISIDDLNEYAGKFEHATNRCLQYLLEIPNFNRPRS